MLQHYIITAIRNICKNKLSFFINLIGLSLGLSSAFVISSYILKETSYDKFHTNKDYIFRVLCDHQNVNWVSANAPYVLKDHIDTSMPLVQESCLTDGLTLAKIKQGNDFVKFRGLVSSTPEFFKIFDCKIVYGNLENALKQVNSIVITENTSKKYLQKENPIGDFIEIKINNQTYQLIVVAVIEDFPDNSSIKFDALCSYELTINYFESMQWSAKFKTDWNLNFSNMFVLLADKKAENFQNIWNQIENEQNLQDKEVHYHLQSLTDIHLNSNDLVNDGKRGNKFYIYLFSSIAFIILLVASFNYIILSISMSKMRYKEIGVKKILGSNNKLIRKQFFTESIIISFLAFPIAYALAYYSTDYLNALFNVSLEINIFKHLNQLVAFIALLIGIGFIAGSYVSYYLSRLNPLEIIKFKMGSQNKRINLQYIMLLFQVIIFTGLMGTSFSIYNQIEYLKQADLGINLHNKLSVEIGNHKLTHTSYQSLCSILDNIPEIKDYALATFMPPENSRGVSTAPDPRDESKKVIFESESISHNFFKFFDITCIKGRVFDANFKDDSNKIVVNEEYVKAFGFENPIGKIINEKEIIGVIKNFYNHSLHEDIPPVSYFLVDPKYVYNVGIEYQNGLAQICKTKLENELTKLFPDAEFEIRFIKDEISGLYRDEDNLNKIITYFSLFAIIIALIGIFGQSLFAVKQQTKEIGIRKVNGAKSSNILSLFLKRYFFLCVIANMISWPVICYFIEKWQARFVYKSPVSIGLILLTLCLSVIVVLTTVFFNSWKASNTNPVTVLKYE